MFRGSLTLLYGVFFAIGFFRAPSALAALSVTGSISTSTSNVPFQTYESLYGSGSLGVDLGRYIRLQYTHSQEISASNGFKDPAPSTPSDSAARSDGCSQCIETRATTHVIGNSIDLQIVLYDGLIVMPYITGGAIVKLYNFENQEGGQTTRNQGAVGPVPNLGAGIGFRLNKDFTLKLTHIASPGLAQTKGEDIPRGVWDRRVTLGLSYQI